MRKWLGKGIVWLLNHPEVLEKLASLIKGVKAKR